MPALATYAPATNNEVGLATTAGDAAALTPSQGTSYTYLILIFKLLAIIYQAVAGVLEAGSASKKKSGLMYSTDLERHPRPPRGDRV
jgi:hypothetical protein